MVTGALLAYIFQAYGETVSPDTIMLVMTLPSLVGVAGTFAAGPLAMKFNKKTLILGCAGLLFVYFAILGMVGPHGPFWLLLFAAVLAGICQGGSVTLTSLIIGEYSAPEKRAARMARSGAILNGGAALINIIGGMIAAGNGGANWPYAYYLGIIILPAMVLFFILMPNRAPEAAAPAEHEAGGASAQADDRFFIPPRVLLMDLAVLAAAIAYAAFILNVSTHIIGVYQLGDSSHAGLGNASQCSKNSHPSGENNSQRDKPTRFTHIRHP
jgi:MFS family permease